MAELQAWADLPALVERLEAVGLHSAGEAASVRLLDRAERVRQAASAADGGTPPPDGLAAPVCAAAPRLAALTEPLPQPLTPASTRVLHARSLALQSCAMTVSSLQPSQRAELLLAATKLLLGHLLPWQQAAHCASLGRQGAMSDDAASLAAAADSQIQALNLVLQLLFEDVQAALSGSQPEAALALLEPAALLVEQSARQPSPGVHHLMVLICLCRTLYCYERFARCQAVLAEQPQLEARLAQLAAGALQRLSIALHLPPERRPTWASWSNVLAAAELLCSDGLRPAVQPTLIAGSHAGSSSSSEYSLLHAAAQLMAMAPLECPPATQPGNLARLHASLAILLSNAAAGQSHAALCSPPEGASEAEQLSHREGTATLQRRLAAVLLPALPRIAASLQLLLGSGSSGGGGDGGSSGGGSAGSSTSQQSIAQALLCSAWSPCLHVAVQLVVPRDYDDSSAGNSGGASGGGPSGGSPNPSIAEVQQWDWQGSKRYGLAPPSIASLGDVAAWCEAAAAVLRAVPLAARAAALEMEHAVQPASVLGSLRAASSEQQAAQRSADECRQHIVVAEASAQLVQCCVGLAVAAACSAVHAVGRVPLGRYVRAVPLDGRQQPDAGDSNPLPAAADVEAAQHAVWGLHTAAARLVHWACQPGSGCSRLGAGTAEAAEAAQGSSGLGGGAAEAAQGSGSSRVAGGASYARPLLDNWRSLPLLCLLNATLGAARLLQSQLKGRSAADPKLQYDRFMLAMAAAHWPAVQAITADPAVLAELSRSPADAADLANSLCIAAGCGPGTLALEPELQRLLMQALRCAPQERRAGAAAVWELLMMAENSPRLASVLAVTGGLGLILNWLAHTLARQHPSSSDFLVVNCGCFMLNALASVRRGGDAVAKSAGGGSAAGPTLAAVLHAHARMHLVFPVANENNVELVGFSTEGELLSRVAGILPACVQLAAALMAYWREPEQLAASQLEAAQAAAARSCAFLRCANLGSERGPAAGEGGSSQRCSACRAVWYCGTACSHADWRAGHRRLCKALGAARQTEKEQRRQAAQPSAG